MNDEMPIEDFSAHSEAELLVLATLPEDEDRAWGAIMELQRRGTPEAYAAAVALTQHADPHARAVGAGILGQIGYKVKAFEEEAVDHLLRLLDDPHADVLAAAATAISHRRSQRAIPSLQRLVKHADAHVRLGAVHGLSGHDDPAAIEALIGLSRDSDGLVRDWATFGLGQLTTVDTPALRDACADRLGDGESEVRIEALCGLAARRDSRAFAVLQAVFIQGGAAVETGHLKAARDLGDARLLPHLERLRAGVDEETDGYWASCLDAAIASAQPKPSRDRAA